MDQKKDTYSSAFSPRSGTATVDTATLVAGLYNECSNGVGVSLSSFCHLLAHQRLVSWDFDHMSVLETFRSQTGVPHFEDTLDSMLIDSKQLRQALQALAVHFYGANYGLKEREPKLIDRQTSGASETPSIVERRNSGTNRTFAMEALYKIQALQDLLRDISIRNAEIPFELKSVDERRTVFFQEQVVQSAYEYEHALRKLFSQYESVSTQGQNIVEERLQRTVTARSLYRLARAVRLVPDCIAPEDFHELVQALYTRSPSKTEEQRYFQEMTLLQHDQEADTTWLQPPIDEIPGEPRFSFPELVELFTLAAFHASPPLYAEPLQDCIDRIHEIFQHLLQLPQGEANAFQAEKFLQAVSGFLDDTNDREPSNLVEIWTALDSELPKLAPKKDPHIPQPPGHVLEKLPVQPMTAEQRLDENRRKNPLGRPSASGKKKKKKKGAKVKQPKWREYFYGNVPVHWNQVQWLGKMPEPLKPEIPAMWQMDSKVDMLNHLDDHIRKHRDESSAANVPASGWVLRLQLIDEPLRAPACPKSEEVSTLMETALTSRRLKQYDAAVALLIRARKLWAAIEAGMTGLREWQDVQSLMPTHSPWNTSQSSRGVFRHFKRTEPEKESNVAQSSQEVQQAQEAQQPADEGDADNTIHHAEIVKSKTDTGGFQEHKHKDFFKSFTAAPLTARPSGSASGSEAGTTPQSARGRIPSRPSRTGATPSRRYNPKNDFPSALGEDEDLEELPARATLFFFCELASLHSALQEDELSGLLLWRALGCCKTLSPYDANAAMVWSGLGRVAFYAGSFEVAARLYMRARTIRERSLGGDTIDTATSYNNLACCLAALDRVVEAGAFMELAVEILKELAGEDHRRTQTAMRNLGKVRTAPKKITMEAPYLYSLPVHDFTRDLRRTKKKKKKGRSKSGSSTQSSKSGKKK